MPDLPQVGTLRKKRSIVETNKFLKVDPTLVEIERLMSKISINEETDCWNWTACIDAGGYGRVGYRNRQESAHRIFYAWKAGPIPRGKGKDIPQLDHLCRNRRCCNPKHLELVSHRENILRGDSPSAHHARKTYCKRGHRLPKEFNYFKPSGQGVRVCRICAYEHDPERQEAKRRARYIREHGPGREEHLRKHREQEAARRRRLKAQAEVS